MAYIPRNIDRLLTEWRDFASRKPLLIRGARQVGKTSAVRKLAESFDHFVEINFDGERLYKAVFESGLGVEEICEQMSLLTGVPIEPGKTLLFLDEVQSCPEAIGALRFFHERMPQLHVIAAGSLLEFALAELPSFGVGRVRSVFMYPMSFDEFANALGEKQLINVLAKYHFHDPVPVPLHDRLLLIFKKFMIVGGMPEVVHAYANGLSMLEVNRLLDDLVVSVQADFDKYKARFPAVRLVEVFGAIAAQSGTKFTYRYDGASLSNVQVKECLRLLKLAGLIYPVVHSSANGIPLGAEANQKKTKYLIFDTGIFQRMLGLNVGELLAGDGVDLVNKGPLAELTVGLELIKNSDAYSQKLLYYWHREQRNSEAELDYIEQVGTAIVPLEVKAGTKGSMRSLYLFLEEKQRQLGLRISSENFGAFDTVCVLPIYAVFRLEAVLKPMLKR